MSPQPVTHQSSDQPSDQPSEQPANSAKARLAVLRRSLQRLVKRKLTAFEQTSLDRAALMTLRAEAAALDGKATSNDIVRLDNAARRARIDFHRLCGISDAPKRKQRSMQDIERELRAHAG